MVDLTSEQRVERALWCAELALASEAKRSGLQYSWSDRDAIVGFMREVLRESNGLSAVSSEPAPEKASLESRVETLERWSASVNSRNLLALGPSDPRVIAAKQRAEVQSAPPSFPADPATYPDPFHGRPTEEPMHEAFRMRGGPHV